MARFEIIFPCPACDNNNVVHFDRRPKRFRPIIKKVPCGTCKSEYRVKIAPQPNLPKPSVKASWEFISISEMAKRIANEKEQKRKASNV